jgi:hypothetical protein
MGGRATRKWTVETRRAPTARHHWASAQGKESGDKRETRKIQRFKTVHEQQLERQE